MLAKELIEFLNKNPEGRVCIMMPVPGGMSQSDIAMVGDNGMAEAENVHHIFGWFPESAAQMVVNEAALNRAVDRMRSMMDEGDETEV